MVSIHHVRIFKQHCTLLCCLSCPLQGISKLMSGTISLDDLISAADSALIASLTATAADVSPLLQAPFISNTAPPYLLLLYYSYAVIHIHEYITLFQALLLPQVRGSVTRHLHLLIVYTMETVAIMYWSIYLLFFYLCIHTNIHTHNNA